MYFSSGMPLGRVECTRSWVGGWRSRKAIVRVRARQTDESRSAGKPSLVLAVGSTQHRRVEKQGIAPDSRRRVDGR